VLECWTVPAALASQTTAVRLGSLVLGNTYRHPAVVANMAATLDLIGGGRLVLGIGAGWQPNKHAAWRLLASHPGSRPQVGNNRRSLVDHRGRA
jgi:alkanesulfonate monooxygenase SsuD/methylene tetrahydromethanopterin reductase-like flavin-dependent oxidoreductase (luciferase family)